MIETFRYVKYNVFKETTKLTVETTIIIATGLIFYYLAMWSRWACTKTKMYALDNQSSDKQDLDM